MESIIPIKNRGKLEIENSNIKCFLGKDENYKSSEDLWNELKVNKVKKIENFYYINDEKYSIIYPIPEKQISIITSNGKLYKSTVYFVDDIKNIINGLKMVNPCYFFEGKYSAFKTETDFGKFLFNIKASEIKDVKSENIDFKKLEENYKNICLKDPNKLIDINKNIYLYSKIDGIGTEEYFMTAQRTWQSYELKSFFENKKRDEINDVLYGMFGNYASGKSFFLIYYTYTSNFPSIYLNLKTLKNAFRTKGFSDLLNNELMTLFYKMKKTYEEFKEFISKFLPYENNEFKNLIISLIKALKEEDILIVFDQYKEEIFGNNSFIIKLKKILFSNKSKIKVVISSSMNDGPIRNAYLDNILNSFNLENERGENESEDNDKEEKENDDNENQEHQEEKNDIKKSKEKDEKNDNKKNGFIPYHFMEKLVDENQIKENIKENKMETDKDFNNILKLFNYLPLYYNLCKIYKNDLNDFVNKTKKRIKDKILKINKNEKFNLKYFDYIRKMIDNEITVDELKFYSEYIPFKYFYIEKNGEKMILRTHFPLVKDVWNEIIMKETVDLFDGEIKYDGNVIGSLMELNLIMNIKSEEIKLDIDSFVQVDEISEFGCIIERDSDDLKGKNIFITQKKQNGAFFDMAYIKGKNLSSPKITFIQAKKSLSDNKINKQKMYKVFEASKNNFLSLFNFIPEHDQINLIYITLINNQIRQAIINHDIYKKDKAKKVSELGSTVNSLVYSVNNLYYYCIRNNIDLYYYEPKTKSFYIRNNNTFDSSKIDFEFSLEKEHEFNFIFDISYLLKEYENNKSNCTKINLEYEKNFLKKKRTRPFSYEIDGFDMGKVFDFAEKIFKNVNIISYINLYKIPLDCQYINLSNYQAIICFKRKEEKPEYEVDSFIFRNYSIKYSNNTFKLLSAPILGRDNYFLVVISFDSIIDELKKFLSNK